jgi:6-pyruvoyltetrahydropterin/6-carboxytetrahydropterin synthase
MPAASLTRRVRFAAAHRYRRPEWSDARNAETFGPCAHPAFHGHSYVCDVTVRGDIDPETGFAIDLGTLDRILAAEIITRFDHRNINVDIPEFAEGKLVPTGENLAHYIYERVQTRLGSAGTVVRVRVAEDDTLAATYPSE